jgi:lysozyme family protein
MQDNWEKSFAQMIRSEGGFVNHPSDPGGATNWGVTKKVWEDWVGHQVTVDDMKQLTQEQVKPLYFEKYWKPVKGDDLPIGVDFLVFSFGVNAGTGRATKTLQTALGVVADGAIGPNTMAKIQAADAKDLIEKFSNTKTAFYKSLNTFGTFGKGWLNRVEREKNEALHML